MKVKTHLRYSGFRFGNKSECGLSTKNIVNEHIFITISKQDKCKNCLKIDTSLDRFVEQNSKY